MSSLTELIGLVDDPRELVGRMREMRRRGEISSEVNVSYKEFNNDVIIHTDRGRARRPLIVVKDGVPQVSDDDIERLRNGEIVFEDVVRKGAIEFVDAEEEEDLFIAINEGGISLPSTRISRSTPPRSSSGSVRRTSRSPPSTTPVPPVSPWAPGWSSRRSGSGQRT